MTIVTRFAPSPTGFLHIGGARTALFNWLYARKHNGQFLLRIEDTDRERSTQEAIDAIIDGLSWLGLHWDGEVVYQSRRAARHAEIARQMVGEGKAYYCYCSQEELAAMREEAQKQGLAFRYDRRWRDRDPSDAPKGVNPVIRLKAPLEGETIIEDRVQGEVVVANSQLDDMILLRSDGSPTYMHSVVVDDHDMGITHIIRGDDHLTNAARQLQIYNAMGWQAPVFAHIPLIHGPDGAKLSKRHGALGVEAYRDMGYTPEALRNYLLRLGWASGDEEIIPTQKALELFDIGGIGRSPSRFDFAKLDNLNGYYIREMEDAVLAALILPKLEEKLGLTHTEEDKHRLIRGMAGLKARAKNLNELTEGAAFYLMRSPIPINEKAAALLHGEGKEILSAILPVLQGIEDWEAPVIEAAVRAFAENKGVKLGSVAQPLRAALTGSTTSPPVFEVLEVLGKEESVVRIVNVA